MKDRADKRILQFLLDKGLIFKEDIARIERIADELKREGKKLPLKELLVEYGFITALQAERMEKELSSHFPAQIPGYLILERIGKGAMARVYKARQLSLDRIVAIKILPRRLSNNPEFVDRFYREGKAAAKLNHPNIVQAIDVGCAMGYHYFVMEYIDGHTIHDILAAGKRYSEQEAVEVAIGIADALNHAHKRGLIHRDVKPKNIMITRDGIPKLADMGLAREIADLELARLEAGKAYGTPYYISPEQIRGDLDIDSRADIYSLGATLYHMVTGRVPFDGPNPSAVMLKHLREPLVPPDHINPELSVDLAEVIEIMMAKDRNCRYQSTEELLEDLRAIKTGKSPLNARRIFERTELIRLEKDSEPYYPQVYLGTKEGFRDYNSWKAIALVAITMLLFSVILNVILLLMHI